MENILIVLVIFLIVLVLILITVFCLVFWNFLKVKKQNGSLDHNESMTSDYKTRAKKSIEAQYGQFVTENCVDHEDLPAKGICALSHRPYCELCLTKHDDIKVARKYLDLILDFEWQDLFIIKDEDIGANQLNELFHIKKGLWQDKEIPIIAQQQYKINIENDMIERHTMVKVRTQDVDLLQDSFGQFIKV